MAVYAVKVNVDEIEKVVLVEARLPSQAVRHALKALATATPVKAAEVGRLMAAGVPFEVAKEEVEAEPIALEVTE